MTAFRPCWTTHLTKIGGRSRHLARSGAVRPKAGDELSVRPDLRLYGPAAGILDQPRVDGWAGPVRRRPSGNRPNNAVSVRVELTSGIHRAEQMPGGGVSNLLTPAAASAAKPENGSHILTLGQQVGRPQFSGEHGPVGPVQA